MVEGLNFYFSMAMRTSFLRGLVLRDFFLKGNLSTTLSKSKDEEDEEKDSDMKSNTLILISEGKDVHECN